MEWEQMAIQTKILKWKGSGTWNLLLNVSKTSWNFLGKNKFFFLFTENNRVHSMIALTGSAIHLSIYSDRNDNNDKIR